MKAPAQKIAEAKAEYDRQVKVMGGVSKQAFYDLAVAYLNSIDAHLDDIERRIAERDE